MLGLKLNHVNKGATDLQLHNYLQLEELSFLILDYDTISTFIPLLSNWYDINKLQCEPIITRIFLQIIRDTYPIAHLRVWEVVLF